jgi:hypothetical protein
MTVMAFPAGIIERHLQHVAQKWEPDLQGKREPLLPREWLPLSETTNMRKNKEIKRVI